MSERHEFHRLTLKQSLRCQLLTLVEGFAKPIAY